MIKVPNILSCDVQVHEQKDGAVQLAVVSISKIITKPVEKGKLVKIYKNGVLLYNGTLDKKIDTIDISSDKLQLFVPISLSETIITKEQMILFLGDNSHLVCEIEIDNQPIINSIFKSFLLK